MLISSSEIVRALKLKGRMMLESIVENRGRATLKSRDISIVETEKLCVEKLL